MARHLLVAADNAAIGVQVANLFPKIRLQGTIGFNAGNASDLFGSGNFGYFGMPTLSWNILDFGRTQASIRGAKATRDASIADYRSTVLSALQDTETSLSRYGDLAEAQANLTNDYVALQKALGLGWQ